MKTKVLNDIQISEFVDALESLANETCGLVQRIQVAAIVKEHLIEKGLIFIRVEASTRHNLWFSTAFNTTGSVLATTSGLDRDSAINNAKHAIETVLLSHLAHANGIEVIEYNVSGEGASLSSKAVAIMIGGLSFNANLKDNN